MDADRAAGPHSGRSAAAFGARSAARGARSARPGSGAGRPRRAYTRAPESIRPGDRAGVSDRQRQPVGRGLPRRPPGFGRDSALSLSGRARRARGADRVRRRRGALAQGADPPVGRRAANARVPPVSERRIISTRIEESGTGRLEIEAAEVRVVAGPDRGARAPLGGDTLVIGSAAECGLVLHDETVSARHAEIRIERGGYRIRDLGSKNGILLGGWPIERAPLADRMRLRLGRSELEVRALGGRHAIPLARAGQFGGLVAHSVKMRAVVAALEPIAAADSTVLIEGETGTGKEVVAQELHAAGARAGGPLVVVDCGALAPTLV